MKFISYHLLKVTKKIRIIISNYHSKSNIPKKNIELKNIINKNRDTLKKYSVLIREDQFKKNNYGMSNEIFQKMNFSINESPTYTDLIIFLSRFLEKVNINYLEIGVSVLKNYIQIINSLRNANIIAYDINPVNPNFGYLYDKEEEKMKMGTFEDNQIYYFEGKSKTYNILKDLLDYYNLPINLSHLKIGKKVNNLKKNIFKNIFLDKKKIGRYPRIIKLEKIGKSKIAEMKNNNNIRQTINNVIF